ncbi:MAG: glycosyltransferase family 1 protein [Deltaproteobacteria bacterium]|nr:glycosyltransferase family 1 protein [Deltaproteobacteria bacterium]
MKIVLSSRGSRGDVYPIIEVAAALQQKGHQVTLCVPKLFEKYAKSRKLTPVLYDEDAQLVMHKMGSGWQATRQALSWFAGDIEEQFDVLLEATRQADVLVTSANEPAAPSVSEHRNIPFYRIAYCPIIPGSQPPPLLPWQNLPAIVNRFMWRLLNATIGLVIGRPLDRRRRSLGLKPVGEISEYFAGQSHTILAISELLAPPSSDWMHPFSYVGYCHSPNHEPLDDELIDFIEAGPKPVYLGFGSVSVKDPAKFTRLVLKAVKLAGCRVILGSGWTGLGQHELPDNVCQISETSHTALFPLMAAVAHHGGSGTTHTAVRAGVPQFIMPQIADQFFWGQRISDLGLGLAPVAPTRLTAQALASSLRILANNTSFARRAREMSAKVLKEDGISRAVDIIT